MNGNNANPEDCIQAKVSVLTEGESKILHDTSRLKEFMIVTITKTALQMPPERILHTEGKDKHWHMVTGKNKLC